MGTAQWKGPGPRFRNGCLSLASSLTGSRSWTSYCASSETQASVLSCHEMGSEGHVGAVGVEELNRLQKHGVSRRGYRRGRLMSPTGRRRAEPRLAFIRWNNIS